MNSILEKQIEDNVKKAFWDLIKTDLRSEPQSFDHLILLINEIKELLKQLTPNREDFKAELDEVLNTNFLKMLFIEKSLNPQHFINLILFLMEKIKLYTAPYLDNEIKEWEKNVLLRLKNDIEYAEFLPCFFEKLYYYINKITNDIINYNATTST